MARSSRAFAPTAGSSTIRRKWSIADCQRRYPLHRYERLGRLLFKLRGTKSEKEIQLLRKAAEVSAAGFKRVARMLRR